MLRVDRHGTDLQMLLVGGALQLKIVFMFYVQLHSPDPVKESAFIPLVNFIVTVLLVVKTTV